MKAPIEMDKNKASATIIRENIEKDPLLLKETKKEASELDLLVCGGCHLVYHFVEDFKNHKSSNECTEKSNIRESSVCEPKPQVWAFLLWKNTQNRLSRNVSGKPEKDNSWVMYQKWCKLSGNEREAWVTAGHYVRDLTKFGSTKIDYSRMNKRKIDEKPSEQQVVKVQIKSNQSSGGGGGQILTRSITKPTPTNKINNATNKSTAEDEDEDDEDIDSESSLDTEEEAELAEIEKEALRQQQDKKNSSGNKIVTNLDTSKIETPKIVQQQESNSEQKKSEDQQKSNESISRIAKRTVKVINDPNKVESKEYTVEKILAKRYNPKKKAHEYLLKWEGFSHEENTWEPVENMNTCKALLDEFERNLAKQKEKKAKLEQASKDQQVQPQQQQENTPTNTRPTRNSKLKALGQVKAWCGSISDDNSQGSKRKLDMKSEDESAGEDENVKKLKKEESAEDLINGLLSRNSSGSIIIKGSAKTDSKKVENLSSGVYIMSKDSGLIKINDEEKNKLLNRGAKPSIVRVLQNSNQSQIRIVQKGDPIKSGIVRASSSSNQQKSELSPNKTASTKKPNMQPIITKTTPGKKGDGTGGGVQKLSGIFGVKQHQRSGFNPIVDFTDDEPYDDDGGLPDPFPTDLPPIEPSSPPRPMTLCPLTGKRLMKAEGERTPEPTPSPEPIPEPESKTEPLKIDTDDLKHLATTAVDEQNVATESAMIISSDGTTQEFPADASIMITGEDGTIYRVAGQDENGQTLLVAQDVNGEQQCVYLATEDEAGQMIALAPSALTGGEQHIETVTAGEHHTIVEGGEHQEQLIVNTNIVDQSQNIGQDGQDGMVAQVVKAEAPSPGGTRRVVLMLPGGEYAVTTVDAEQYAALEIE